MNLRHTPITGILLWILIIISSCSVERQIGKVADKIVINNTDLNNAHIGMSIYDAASGKFLYNYQGNKYFVPASNTKIFSCYAGLENLGDSLPGIRYIENDTAVFLLPTGDPTLLHKDFINHPVIDFLRSTKKNIYITDQYWKSEPLGSGWLWNNYNESYMVERSPLPIYGNLIRWIQERTAEKNMDSMAFDQSLAIYSLPEVNWKVRFDTDLTKKSFYVQRSKNENTYQVTEGTENKKEQEVPFVVNGLQSALELLKDTIYKEVSISTLPFSNQAFDKTKTRTIYSQPTDTVLKIMMHRSDNFLAEQILLMSSNEKFAVLDDDSIIRNLLNNSLKDLPQKPRWADGSGLSHYNQFTPESFVAILNKMKDEYGIERIKTIFPTAGSGTLDTYPKTDSGYLFAKTGTLSGVVALSGFLYTRKNKLLVFSILVNNHQTTATEVRNNIRLFLSTIRNKF